MHDAVTIPVMDAGAGYRELKAELDEAYHRVMDGGWYILGEELAAFESEFAAYCGVSHCAGTANGLEALQLILLASGIGPGDEVIVPGLTFIATWLAVSHCGARPVPVDVEERTFNLDPDLIEAALTPRTRAIVAVHLFGHPANMEPILKVASAHGLRVFEDAAQAHGAEWRGRRTGALADAAAFSFYPAKNLGAFGDAGAVVSDDESLMERILALRNYGGRSKYEHGARGHNSRLDPLQAAFLRVKLRRLDEWNQRRRDIAAAYQDGLLGCRKCVLPAAGRDAAPVWHQFVIRHPSRDALRLALAARHVDTAIHYPVPPHLSRAYADLGGKRGDLPVTERLADTVVSLPMGPHLGEASAARVIAALRAVEDLDG